MEQLDTIITQIGQSPWANSYWFARMLINSDKYGAVGKDTNLLENMIGNVEPIIIDQAFDESTQLSLIYQQIDSLLHQRFVNAKTKQQQIQLFYKDLVEKLRTIQDVTVFLMTIKLIVIPINSAMQSVPSNDRKFTEAAARQYLEIHGNAGLATVINMWDDLGVNGSLTAERAIITSAFSKIRYSMPKLNDLDENLLLTAFMQEFERRVAQKRKSRAGGSLEDVTSFIFHHYNIQATHAPEHFQADIEVDKWIRTKDNWYIGISCKRTLRERWKQVSSASSEILSKFKIKQVWHVITFDEDLSDDKITLLGSQRHIFYLPDQSRKYQHFSQHMGMKAYVRPMSSFVEDIRQAQRFG
ncbi:type II restriction endonuclease [Herpetosiphon llansteffanensis]|uniref:type II restriction endonuclease n=1 Tax=Herpetosiphon llansteffanensis TaxID=2094568 RepID=UPI000D7C863E|nr:type II restriction endonuclease [Herpetosiphon llansteffanensis]